MGYSCSVRSDVFLIGTALGGHHTTLRSGSQSTAFQGCMANGTTEGWRLRYQSVTTMASSWSPRYGLCLMAGEKGVPRCWAPDESHARKQKMVSRGQKQESAVSDDFPEATSEARSLPGHGLPEFHPLRTENQGDSGDPTSPKSQPGKTSCFIPIVYVSHLSH